MTVRGPQLELRVPLRVQRHHQPRLVFGHRQAGHGLGVAAVQSLGQADDRAQQADGRAVLPREIAEPFVRFLRGGLAMVPRNQPNDIDFVRIEAAQPAVFDQVIRVFVVALVADVGADVVDERAEFEPAALARPEGVPVAGGIEELERQARDLLRVVRPVPAPLGELDHAAPPHVRVPLGGPDVGRVALDVVEDQPFALLPESLGVQDASRPFEVGVGKKGLHVRPGTRPGRTRPRLRPSPAVGTPPRPGPAPG